MKKSKINCLVTSPRSTSALITALLILSGDIQTNPGPAAVPQAKLDEEFHHTVTCESCMNHYKLDYDDNSISKISLNKSFQWHCLNPKCAPNYHSGMVKNISKNENLTLENRYKLLGKPKKYKYKK